MKRLLFSLGVVALVIAGSTVLTAATVAAFYLPGPWPIVFGLGLVGLAYGLTFRWVMARPKNGRHS